ncbi:hypothetical protein ACIQAL_28590 [Pseudomonas sp. NPDC088368]|jgi:hypothetical protein|uniref:hypothetical protein n=1 Tax=Pseudomonas sp. NPDC088368 TaxID=3364453 RepID=UPI00381F7559
MSDVKPVLNEPFIQDLREDDELPISKPLNIIFKTDLADIVFHAFSITDAVSGEILASSNLRNEGLGSERPVTLEWGFNRLGDKARIGNKARASVLIIDSHQQRTTYSGLKHVLKA